MGAPIYLPQLNSNGIYKVGRVGHETGAQDEGGIYTALLRSEKISPLGETGWCKFRRVVLRVRHTSSYSVKMRVYVDGVQTKTYDQTDMTSGTMVDQEVTFTGSAPTAPPAESILQVDITKPGTYIEVELQCASNGVTGSFMPESVEVHYIPLRRARQGEAAS